MLRVTVLESQTEKNSAVTFLNLERTPPPYTCAHWFCVIFQRSISVVATCFSYHMLVHKFPLQ